MYQKVNSAPFLTSSASTANSAAFLLSAHCPLTTAVLPLAPCLSTHYSLFPTPCLLPPPPNTPPTVKLWTAPNQSLAATVSQSHSFTVSF
jgi:hypothetical protein